jgi:hypothetical protein
MPKDITLGADPEFGLMQGRSVVSAGDVIPNGTDREFGCDGGGTAAEIRPRPSTDPLAIVGESRRILQSGAYEFPETLRYKWKAGNVVEGQPLGGHIHFGFLNNQVDRGVVIRALDTFLAQSCVLIEGVDEARARRCNSGYGHLSDHRQQNWGIEYRVLGSWLTSPYIAAGILCLAKSIAYEAAYKELKWGSGLLVSADDFNHATSPKIRNNVEKLWKTVEKFHLYKLYKPYINIIECLIKNKCSWFPKGGMRQAWGIIEAKPDKKLSMHQVTLESIWHPVLKLEDLE